MFRGIKVSSKFLYTLPVFLLTILSFYFASNIQRPQRTTPSQAAAIRGQPNDFWADIELGQPDFTEGIIGERTGNKVNNPGGVLVDKTVDPNRIYVSDNANSRILGYRSVGTCANNGSVACTNNSDCSGSTCTVTPNKVADMVIGQSSVTGSACNGDFSYQNYPNSAIPSASTLCGMPEKQISPTEGGAFMSMDVDANGNLYMPDWINNRILKYLSPLASGGNTVADEVWGQADMAGQQCNKGQSNPANNTLCLGNNTSYNPAFMVGLDIDVSGNLWVTDTVNNRILRFSLSGSTPSKTADLVLGQTSFTTNGSGSALNQMRYPGAVKVLSNGVVLVADSYNNRVLKFSPPLTSGMSGVVWGSNFDHPSGLELNVASQGGGVWVTNSFKQMVELWNEAGTSKTKVIADTLKNCAAGKECYLQDPRSGVGVTKDGDVWASSSSSQQDVFRFRPITAPDPTWNYPAEARLYYPPAGRNRITTRSFGGLMGVAVSEVSGQKQLVVADQKRLLFWNNVPTSLTNFKAADGGAYTDFTQEASFGKYGKVKTDASGNIYVMEAYERDFLGIPHFQISKFTPPLTNGELPAATMRGVINNLEGQQVIDITNADSSGFLVGDIQPAKDGSYLWLVEKPGNRAIRIRNPFTANAKVDVVLGQTTPTGNLCNRGGSKTLNTLCWPGSITMDSLNNVYIGDNSLETDGNGRLLEFNASLFPTNNSATIYAPNASRVFYDTVEVMAPVFDSSDRFVVGFNPYWGNMAKHSLDYNLNLLGGGAGVQMDDFYAMPYATAFDSAGNLYVADHNRWKVNVYLTPFSQGPTVGPTISPSQACANSGGTWTNFNQSCKDDCIQYIDPNYTCLFGGSYWSCDCTAANQCWNGNLSSCVPISGSAPTIAPTDSPSSPTLFNVKINFQPSGSALMSGYLPDYGATYTSRGNGYTYGWTTTTNSSAPKDRNSTRSPNQAYDTLIHTQAYGTYTWEILVPNGTYTVRLVAGDPSYYDSIYKFNVESVRVVDGTPNTNTRWIEGTQSITVSDGKLTLTNVSGSSNNKVNFIEITQGIAGPTSTPAPTIPPPTPTQPPNSVIVNDTASGITYTGPNWFYSSNRTYTTDYQLDVHATTQDGEYFEYTFTGTGVELISEKYSDQGDIEIYIDNILQQPADTYNSTRLAQQVVYQKLNLTSGTHTIKGVKKSGQYMLVDAIRYYPSPVTNNLITNGTFENGVTGWTFNQGDAVASFTTTTSSPFSGTRSALVSITTPGSSEQLYQSGLSLTSGSRYRLSFAAKSNTGHDLDIHFRKHSSTSTDIDRNFSKCSTNTNCATTTTSSGIAYLTSSWQSFTFEFEAYNFTGTTTDTRLRFWPGPYDAANDQYFIDNVTLTKI